MVKLTEEQARQMTAEARADMIAANILGGREFAVSMAMELASTICSCACPDCGRKPIVGGDIPDATLYLCEHMKASVEEGLACFPEEIRPRTKIELLP